MQWITKWVYVYIYFLLLKVYLQGRFLELGLLVQKISTYVAIVMCCQIFCVKNFTICIPTSGYESACFSTVFLTENVVIIFNFYQSDSWGIVPPETLTSVSSTQPHCQMSSVWLYPPCTVAWKLPPWRNLANHKAYLISFTFLRDDSPEFYYPCLKKPTNLCFIYFV